MELDAALEIVGQALDRVVCDGPTHRAIVEAFVTLRDAVKPPVEE